ncbi:hypothetical protein B566_EDAN017663, partial [Ephemera danica]
MRVLRFLRYAFSTAIMLGAAPEFLLLWSIWKGVSLLLPAWVYQVGDDFTYSIYQRLVLFFFNHCTVDWILTNMVAVEQGSLGHLRFVMKHELQMLPLYGFYFYQHGCIYLKRTREVAREHNLPELKYHLTPRSRGAWLVVQSLHSRLDAVYDITVGYAGKECGKGAVDTRRNKAPQLVDFLLGRCPEVHIHVRRIPMSTVPLDETKFQLWVHDLFTEKD